MHIMEATFFVLPNSTRGFRYEGDALPSNATELFTAKAVEWLPYGEKQYKAGVEIRQQYCYQYETDPTDNTRLLERSDALLERRSDAMEGAMLIVPNKYPAACPRRGKLQTPMAQVPTQKSDRGDAPKDGWQDLVSIAFSHHENSYCSDIESEHRVGHHASPDLKLKYRVERKLYSRRYDAGQRSENIHSAVSF